MRFNHAAAAVGLFVPALAAMAHDELKFAHNGAGQLVLYTPFELPQPLIVSTFPELPGWVSVSLGVAALDVDEPANNLFILPETTNIELRLVSQDPGMAIYWNLVPVPIGGAIELGSPYFHVHPIWGRPQGSLGDTGGFRIQAHDTTGQFQDSAVLDLQFVNVPAPASLTLAGVIGLMSCRRRR